MIPLYVAIYNNDSLKITPQEMENFFKKERFKYEEIRMFLSRWDYRVEMIFESKQNRTIAIDEVKKLKN